MVLKVIDNRLPQLNRKLKESLADPQKLRGADVNTFSDLYNLRGPDCLKPYVAFGFSVHAFGYHLLVTLFVNKYNLPPEKSYLKRRLRGTVLFAYDSACVS